MQADNFLRCQPALYRQRYGAALSPASQNLLVACRKTMYKAPSIAFGHTCGFSSHSWWQVCTGTLGQFRLAGFNIGRARLVTGNMTVSLYCRAA